MKYKNELDGSEINLIDTPFHSGAEYSIHFVVGFDDLLAAVLKPESATPTKLAKIAYMCGVTLHHEPSLAWPLFPITDEPGNRVGYVMNRIPGITLQEFIDTEMIIPPGQRLPLSSRIRIAINLSQVVSKVHVYKMAIGDFHPGNILVGTDTSGKHDHDLRVSVVDTTDFRIQGRNPDTCEPIVFKTENGMEEYLPAEVQGITEGLDLGVDADYFALAVMIWLLIFGRHPYSIQRIRGTGPLPSFGSLIKNGQWPYSPLGVSPDFVPVKTDTEFSTLPVEIRSLFIRVFVHAEISNRPHPDEWEVSLDTWFCQESAKEVRSIPKITKAKAFSRNLLILGARYLKKFSRSKTFYMRASALFLLALYLFWPSPGKPSLSHPNQKSSLQSHTTRKPSDVPSQANFGDLQRKTKSSGSGSSGSVSGYAWLRPQ